MRNKRIKSESKSNIIFAALAVDIVCFRIVDDNLQVLLGIVNSDNNIFNGQWAYIGGLVRVHEVAEESVDRLLKDRVGINQAYKEQLYTFSEVDRDPRGRVISVAYIAIINKNQAFGGGSVESIWRNTNQIPKLAYDHNKITKVAIGRLKSKIVYTDIARYFMPKEFTLSELQKVYEIILNEKYDKRNFRKKVLSLNILKDTKQKVKKGAMRPASLYTFKQRC